MAPRSLFLPCLAAALLAACSSGPVRRVSEPAASIQQLTVQPDGHWNVELRINNFSNVAMRFDHITLDIAFDNGAAAKLDVQPQLEIGPESADVVQAQVNPLPAGRARLAAALADGRGLTYSLRGNVQAGPLDGSSKGYDIKRDSALSPVPGLPGVLR